MATYKCKMCGGSFEIKEGMTVCECEYCGTSQTLPRSDSEQLLNMFNRANHFRQQCEFDKAAEIYERMTAQSDDPEVYWSLVLCRYGIEYVDDPLTKKKIPTCHRTQYKSILEDADYNQALTLADTMQRSIYQQEAQYIDSVQKGILEISNKEQPFDVFICYKESDENGRRTPDSVLAQELYYGLVNEGFKVFFSRITLESKLGTEYEPYIFAALNSAKVMVVVGTKPEYFNAVWVRNEWSRYLMLMQNDRSRTLIPAYKDMDPYDLPEALSMFQAQDMSKLGFMQDLIRGIKKIAKDDDPVKTVVKETVVQSAPVNSSATPLLKRAAIFLGDSDWNSANEYCEKVLDIDPENAQAYLYKVLAKLHITSEGDMLSAYYDSFLDSKKYIDRDPDYKKAYKYGDDGMKSKLTDFHNAMIYNGALKAMGTAKTDEEYRRVAEGFNIVADFKDSREKSLQCEENAKEYIYTQAVDALRNAKTDKDFDAAAAIFSRVPDHKDSEAMITECGEKAKEYLYTTACVSLEKADSTSGYLTAKKMFQNPRIKDYKDTAEKTKEAKTLAEMQEIYENASTKAHTADADGLKEAARLFESISDFKDSADRARICWGKAAEYDKAAKRKHIINTLAVSASLCAAFLVVLFTVIIPAVKYNNGLKAIESGEYDKAVVIFQELGNYKDSVDQITVAQNSKAYDSAVELLNAGKYEEAISAFNSLGDFSDSPSQITKATELKNQRDYDNAMALLNEGKYEEAISAFNALGNFQDSASQAAYAKIKAVSVGDTIIFGDYSWIVLEKTDNSALILAKDVLFEKAYNDEDKEVTWEECTLRKYLNGGFYNSFSDEERAMIQEVTNSNPDNADSGTNGGNDTKDKIYLLSIDEAKGLSGDILKATAWWWLRSPGENSMRAAEVMSNGDVDSFGNYVYCVMGVRPALNLKF
ncbi:MAG: TIR domain-containing protein [Oscillospiraceae bacterium]|nr:TIR domain-containing protein [Oscillospiraceae bacterium]